MPIPGISNVAVTLTITYPDTTVVSVTTLTDTNGLYSFADLLDENFNGSGTN